MIRTTEQIERVARAICVASGRNPSQVITSGGMKMWQRARYIKRAKAAITAMAAMGDIWQPIETCPIYTDVLIWGHECPVVHINRRFLSSSGKILFTKLGDAKQPTHWMPLPEPPK